MPEAAVVKNQTVGGQKLTVFEAARKLHLGCFTSVPLFQGQLAREGPTEDGLTPAQTAIQFARSAPGTLGPIVGQKRPEHLSENLEVSTQHAWNRAQFTEFLG
jgi:diketogulonate reductase-like aldo/keto reductase